MRELLHWGRQLGSSLLLTLALVYGAVWWSGRGGVEALWGAGVALGTGLALLLWARLMPWDGA